MSVKHLGRDISKFAGRHNVSEADTIVQFSCIATDMIVKRFKCVELTARESLPDFFVLSELLNAVFCLAPTAYSFV